MHRGLQKPKSHVESAFDTVDPSWHSRMIGGVSLASFRALVERLDGHTNEIRGIDYPIPLVSIKHTVYTRRHHGRDCKIDRLEASSVSIWTNQVFQDWFNTML